MSLIYLLGLMHAPHVPLSQHCWTSVATLLFVAVCAVKLGRAAAERRVKDEAEKMMDDKEKKGGRRSLVSQGGARA